VEEELMIRLGCSVCTVCDAYCYSNQESFCSIYHLLTHTYNNTQINPALSDLSITGRNEP